MPTNPAPRERTPPLDANVACRCDTHALPCVECRMTDRRRVVKGKRPREATADLPGS